MKKTAAFILALSLLAHSFAVEYGGTLGESVELYTNDFDPVAMEEKTKLTLFFRAPFGPSSYFAAEGNATPTYDVNDLTEISDGDFVCPLDLTLFKFAHAIKQENAASVNLAAGRFAVADSTGLILNQPADGLSAAYNSQSIVVSGYAGYTGLLNGHNATIINGDIDKSNNDFYYLASPFIIGQASVYFPYLFFNQSLGVEGLTAIGTKGPNGDNADYNRFYGTLSLNGSVGKNKFYVLSTTFGAEVIDGDFDKLSNLSQLSFTYYMPEFYDSQVTATALYASGKQGPFAAFTGLSSMEATYSAFAPEYSGLLKAGLCGTMKPMSNLLASLGTDIVFSCPKEDFEYAGVQFYGTVVYQLYTDMQLGLMAHQYVGDDKNENETSLTLCFTMAF